MSLLETFGYVLAIGAVAFLLDLWYTLSTVRNTTYHAGYRVGYQVVVDLVESGQIASYPEAVARSCFGTEEARAKARCDNNSDDFTFYGGVLDRLKGLPCKHF